MKHLEINDEKFMEYQMVSSDLNILFFKLESLLWT